MKHEVTGRAAMRRNWVDWAPCVVEDRTTVVLASASAAQVVVDADHLDSVEVVRSSCVFAASGYCVAHTSSSSTLSLREAAGAAVQPKAFEIEGSPCNPPYATHSDVVVAALG